MNQKPPYIKRKQIAISKFRYDEKQQNNTEPKFKNVKFQIETEIVIVPNYFTGGILPNIFSRCLPLPASPSA